MKELISTDHCGGETFQSIFSLFSWKYSAKSLLHSDDCRQLFRTLHLKYFAESTLKNLFSTVMIGHYFKPWTISASNVLFFSLLGWILS